jgi:hypothetical protein
MERHRKNLIWPADWEHNLGDVPGSRGKLAHDVNQSYLVLALDNVERIPLASNSRGHKGYVYYACKSASQAPEKLQDFVVLSTHQNGLGARVACERDAWEVMA